MARTSLQTLTVPSDLRFTKQNKKDKEAVCSLCSHPLLGEMRIIPLVRAWFVLMQLGNTMHVQVKESMGGKAGRGSLVTDADIAA